MSSYQYACLQCSRRYPGQPFRLRCDDCGDAALLEAQYAASNFTGSGFFRYRCWLPIHRTLPQAALPLVYPSRSVGHQLGLRDLDLLFSGYDSDIRSQTFKEFEAYSVLAHAGDQKNQVMVVASAGNTARAFAEVALRENLAVLLVVPDTALKKMELSLPQNSKVVFVASTHEQRPSEYAEAIAVSKVLASSPHFFGEGGVYNVARRDGLGVAYLHAQYNRCQRGEPAYRYYFQAIGSGTGAIGSYSMYRRLQQAGLLPKEHQLSLMLVQNAPFIPVVEHWRAGRKDFEPYEPCDSLERNSRIVAAVLGNRNPPYAVRGGLADLLQESEGAAFAVENHEIAAMQELFAREEGLDLVPAAAAAAAGLKQAAESGQLDLSQPVLLHLTGGGRRRFERDFPQRYPVRAAATVDWTDLENSPRAQQELVRNVERQFGF